MGCRKKYLARTLDRSLGILTTRLEIVGRGRNGLVRFNKPGLGLEQRDRRFFLEVPCSNLPGSIFFLRKHPFLSLHYRSIVGSRKNPTHYKVQL